jgi:hypothetical protein
MNEKNVTGIRVYILTVDSETNTVLKTEEEDPNTGHRTELAPSFPIEILVGGKPVVEPASIISTPPTYMFRPPDVPKPVPPRGVPPPPPSKKAAEDEKADKGEPPKV